MTPAGAHDLEILIYKPSKLAHCNMLICLSDYACCEAGYLILMIHVPAPFAFSHPPNATPR